MTVPRWLSAQMRDVLIEHIDQRCAVDIHDWVRMASLRALIDRRLIAFMHEHRSLRMVESYITDAGREVLAAVLADYADALIRAGHKAEIRAETQDTLPEPVA